MSITFNPLKTIKEFVSYYESKHNDSTPKEEIECTFFNTNIECFTNMYRYKSCEKSAYIELSMRSKDVKYRRRIPMSTFNSFNVTNTQMLNSAVNEVWEKKVVLDTKTLESQGVAYGDFKCSTEEPEKLCSYSLVLSKITILYVRSILLKLDHVLLELRLTTDITSSKNTNKKLSLSTYLTNFRFNYNEGCKAELEVHQHASSDILRKELEDLIRILYAFKTLENLDIILKPIECPLSTKVSDTKEVLSQLDIYITPKVDGRLCYFEVKNSKLYLEYDYRRLSFQSSISFDVRGWGEYYNKGDKRTIYPFYIYGSDDRKESIIKFVEDVKNAEDVIVFRSKPIVGPFKSTKHLLMEMYKMFFNKYVYEIDGIIVFKKDSMTDHKVKMNNTVDCFSYLNVVTGILTNNLEVKIGYFENGVIVNIATLKPPGLVNDKDLHMLVHDGMVIPYHFIAEYSSVNERIERYRIEKTNRIYTNKYKGNQASVIKRSIELDDGKFNMQMLSHIYENPNEYPDDVSILDTMFTTKEKFFYNGDISIRTGLNHITNIAKTNLIGNAINGRMNGQLYRTVLDIDAGNGGDQGKLYTHNVTHIVATDIDSNALQIYRNRRENLNKGGKSKAYILNTINDCIKNESFITKVRKYSKSFDLINYQLAIHFYWEPDYIPQIIKVFKEFSHRGTKITISTNYGDEIKKRMEGKEKLDFVVDRDRDIHFTYYKSVDNKIVAVYPPSTGNEGSPENLVFRDDLIEHMSKAGFMLEDIVTFDDFHDLKLMSEIEHTSSRSVARKMYNNFTRSYDADNDLKALSELYIGYTFICL